MVTVPPVLKWILGNRSRKRSYFIQTCSVVTLRHIRNLISSHDAWHNYDLAPPAFGSGSTLYAGVALGCHVSRRHLVLVGESLRRQRDSRTCLAEWRAGRAIKWTFLFDMNWPAWRIWAWYIQPTVCVLSDIVLIRAAYSLPLPFSLS